MLTEVQKNQIFGSRTKSTDIVDQGGTHGIRIKTIDNNNGEITKIKSKFVELR